MGSIRSLRTLIFGLAMVVSATLVPAGAQDRRGAASPGEFDFYVLALSWSPSFCETQGERSVRSMQCAGDRLFSFVVHGLWPQFQRGFPEYCQVPAPRIDNRTVNGMLDIMPAPGLVRHQWEKHGTCSGERSSNAYFERVRQARAKIRIPLEFEGLTQVRIMTPAEVEDAFVRANPGLTTEMMGVQCDDRRLREVRICLGRDMNFTSCQEVDRRSCRRDRVMLPPVRASR